MYLGKALAVLACHASLAFALPKVSRLGKYLYTDDGTRFSFKGIAYQQQGTVAPNSNFPEPTDFVDPLADAAGCARDLPFLKQLGVNSIRVYSVDSSLNHDACMQALDAAGIYTIIDLSLPSNGSINRQAPAYTIDLLNQYIETINAFTKYSNVIAFNVANEVVGNLEEFPNATESAPFIKAAARDVKAYLKSQNSGILLSYSSTDGPDTWRRPLADYLNCGSDDVAIDIFGLNNYEWCGDSTFAASYSGTNTAFKDLPYPAYFSEFGCNTQPPRLWTETAALFSSDMTSVWSGGIAFEYFADGQNFGMTTLSSDNKTITPNDDFARLVTQYGAVSLPTTPARSDAGSNTFAACQPPTSGFLGSTTLPPTPSAAECACFEQSAFSCVFKGTSNTPQEVALIGSLTDTACSLIGTAGGNCSAIGGNGQTGVYGPLSFCSNVQKLSSTFSLYYDLTQRNAASCNFAGNATTVPNAPASPAAAAAASASCAASEKDVLVPSASVGSVPGTATGSGATATGSPGAGSGGNGNGAAAVGRGGLVGVAVSVLMGLVVAGVMVLF
ncbi:1,3-beta-glucanosyltransferase [Hysterangium stoloniferum]|nr:1,3-beta-glucanosyltransferase [Hysterangium stoloniferum]